MAPTKTGGPVTSSLLGLPEELRDDIASLPTNPFNIINMALTCRVVRSSALRRLYYNTTLDLRPSGPVPSPDIVVMISTLFRERNLANLDKIRHLRLKLPETSTVPIATADPPKAMEMIEKVVLYIARYLPRNLLLTATFETISTHPPEVLGVLAACQSRLENWTTGYCGKC